MKQSLGIGILAVFLSVSMHGAANAEFSGGLKLASHYAWQGGTESNERPVLQGSMYYNFASCYVGFWASGTGDWYAGTEIDYETGCGGSLMENVGYSVDFLYLTYPGETHGNNLVELRLKLSADLGIASAWARLGLPKWGDNEGAINTSGHNRPQVGFTVPFGDTPFSASATFGQDNKRRCGDDYDWYHLSLDTSFQGFGLSAFYSGRGDRDPNYCNNGSVTAGDEIAGISISRGF
jgi:uncharacterized protein (TIGR02001 family)